MICRLCGKKMGMFENQYSEFENDPGVCIQCHNKIQNTIKPEIKKMVRNQVNNQEIQKIISEKYSSSSDGIYYLNLYIKSVLKDVNTIFTENERQEQFAELKVKAFKLKVTTGYNFEGYKIVDYKGIVSGETVIGTGLMSEFLASVDDTLGIEANSFSDKMKKVKELALTKLKIQSATIGGNAVIGVDFDYLTFSSNMIGVSANGTSVVIEKIDQ